MSRPLHQWDLVLVPYSRPEQPHYLIVISPEWVAVNPDFKTVNDLICHTIRPPDRPPRTHEVFLDEADGLDRKTVSRCHIFVEFARDRVLSQRGTVSSARRQVIRRKVRESFGL